MTATLASGSAAVLSQGYLLFGGGNARGRRPPRPTRPESSGIDRVTSSAHAAARGSPVSGPESAPLVRCFPAPATAAPRLALRSPPTRGLSRLSSLFVGFSSRGRGGGAEGGAGSPPRGSRCGARSRPPGSRPEPEAEAPPTEQPRRP